MATHINRSQGAFSGTAHGEGVDRKGMYASPWIALVLYHIEQSGVAQVELAKAMGVSRSTLNHYLTGRIAPPIDDRLVKLARRLGLSEVDEKKVRSEAMLANSPEEVREMVNSLQKEVESLRRKLAKAQ